MSAKGQRIRVAQLEIYAEEEGEGSPALVFIHYWGGSRRTWSEVIAPLSERFRCIAVGFLADLAASSGGGSAPAVGQPSRGRAV
jgi:pimeloyl-ACP methyl ester carboxylesterase